MGKLPITRVTLGAVYTDSGVVCKNPIVKLIGHPNIYVNCIDNTKGIYELQLPDNSDLKSLKFKVDCNSDEDCRNCEPQIITKYFCDDEGDCPDCHDCVDGICVERCPEDVCLSGECVDCTTDEQCDCNQICNANGDCVCPQGSKLCSSTSECCKECCSATDCPACYVCQGGDCIAIDCPNGICDPTNGTCVECITADQCGDNECCNDNECECCEGYTRDVCTGKCVPLSVNACKTSEGCGVCSQCTNFDPCTGYGVCTPVSCPPGSIAAEVDGECQCIEECDCDNPGCSKTTDYCKDFGSVGCGCVPCEGDCTMGCLDPCYCNPQTNNCEENPCINTSCVNGLDCGEGCGCDEDTGLCVPCSTLSCATNKCADVLGCECVGVNCQESNGCNDAPCSVESDCGVGCTCEEGKCVSCDNFSCDNGECDVKPGCACNGNICEDDGDDGGDCNDNLEIIKDDANCTVTGKLTKDNCCQCPQLTINAQGQLFSETDNEVTLNFIGEVRKGVFDGISVGSVPRVDEFSNDSIAENEPPTSGTIQLSYRVTYDIFDTSTGTSIYQGSTITSPVTTNASYPITGTTAEVNFNGIVLPKIGMQTQDGNELRVVSKVQVTFTLINSLQFPNECSYTGGEFAKYVIETNSDYNSFGNSSSFSNGKGGIVSTSGCRKPFFRWTKSKDVEFNESAFRKVYVDGGPSVYEDVLTVDEDLESCYYYLLETDCTCDEPQSDYIVLCNPGNLDFTLTNCNKCFELNSFDTCDVNEDVDFNILAGTIDKTFKASTAPVGQLFCSDSEIDSVVFSIVCDEADICTKTYNVNPSNLAIDHTISCSPDNQKFTVTFPSTDTTGVYIVEKVEVGGFTLTGSLSKTLDVGAYTATVYWKGGCDPIQVDIEEDCCDFILSPITRNCDGSVTCTQDPGVTYTIGGSVVADICATVSSWPLDQTLNITATKGDCIPLNITVPSLGSFCCEDFKVIINQINESLAIATVNGAPGAVAVTAFNNTTNTSATVTDNGNKTYNITGYSAGDNITVTAVDSTGVCSSAEDANFVAGECEITLSVEEFIEGVNCRLRASVNGQTCTCKFGSYILDITNVVPVDDGANLQIQYQVALQGFDASSTAGELYAGEEGSTVAQGFIEGSGTLTVPIQTGPSQNCIGTQVEAKIIEVCSCDHIPCGLSSECPNGCSCTVETGGVGSSGQGDGDCYCDVTKGNVEVKVMQGSSNLIDNPTVTSVVVTVDGVTAVEGSGGVYTANTGTTEEGDTVTIDIDVVQSGSNFTTTYTQVVNTTSGLSAINICEVVTQTSESTAVEFELKGLELEDNCAYDDISVILNVFANGTVSPPSPRTIALSPTDEDARWVKFSWIANAVVVFEEFVGSAGNFTSTLPLADTVIGDEYTATGECLPCSDSDTITPCCVPEVTVDSVSGCNESMVLAISGNPGSYEVVYDSVTYPVTVPAGGSTTLNVTGPLVGTSGVIQVASATNCNETFTVQLYDLCMPTISTTCTGDLEYTITIGGCGDVTLAIQNGAPGVVSGNTITGADESNPPRILVTVVESGCEITINESLTGPDPSCVYTPGYNPVIAYTPDYTPDYAPTYAPGYSPATYVPTYLSPSYAPSYVPTYSTPSYTPSYTTPSYTPIYAPQYTPTYTPGYSPASYTPSYLTPSYVPNYTPDYVPIYSPNYSPDYVPQYTPTYLTPSYTPSYSPIYTPNYVPSAPLGACCDGIGGCSQTTGAACSGTWYQGSSCPGPCMYVPSYFTPSYEPNYTPNSFTPTYGTPSYVPNYVPTSYTPSYSNCTGCTSTLGVCCNEIPTEAICNTQGTCFWTGSICDCVPTDGA